MKPAILHFYRAERQHQLNTYGNSGLHFDGVDQKQFTGGSSAYGFHAMAALGGARGRIRFREELKATIKKHRKASKAAKNGWKRRRANQ